MSNLKDIHGYLQKTLKKRLKDIRIDHNELSMTIESKDLFDTLLILRDDALCYFKQLIDLTAIDYPDQLPDRFEVNYLLLSLRHNVRLKVKVKLDETTPLPSIIKLYPNANWFEREVFDMFGIGFTDHPDLRRILTDYNFRGHPLRKDFPLTGYTEVRYDETLKRVVEEPVKLVQAFRDFDFLSPWEGMTDVQLPGDEKAIQPKYVGEKD